MTGLDQIGLDISQTTTTTRAPLAVLIIRQVQALRRMKIQSSELLNNCGDVHIPHKNLICTLFGTTMNFMSVQKSPYLLKHTANYCSWVCAVQNWCKDQSLHPYWWPLASAMVLAVWPRHPLAMSTAQLDGPLANKLALNRLRIIHDLFQHTQSRCGALKNAEQNQVFFDKKTRVY